MRGVVVRQESVLCQEVFDETDIRGVWKIDTPDIGGFDADRVAADRRKARLIDGPDGVERRRLHDPGLHILLDELNAHVARIEDEGRVRLGVAQLAEFSGEVDLPEAGVDLAGDLILEEALEAADHVLSGLVVRRHEIGALDPRFLQVSAHGLGLLVVLG